MAYRDTTLAGTGLFSLSGDLQRYWLTFLRVVLGWWFLHAGLGKLLTDGLNFTYGPVYLKGMTGTALGPLPVWMGEHLAWLVTPGVPVFETLIGLGVLLGAATRLAAFGGVFFMTLFWVGNSGFNHGLVNGDLFGLLLFVSVAVFAAGRHYGLDAYLERTALVDRHPRLTYLLG